MGFHCPLQEAFCFTYRADLADGLVEHEIDHVLVGSFDGVPVPNADEVDSWCWAEVEDLWTDLHTNPGRYSAWFLSALGELRERGLV